MGRLAGRVTIITGAGGGIGSAMARMFAAEGALMALTDVNAEAAEGVAGDVEESGGTAFGMALDVTDEAAVRAAVEATVQRYGRLDVLVNNAGMAFQHRIVDIELKDWHRVMDVNLTGTMLMMKHAAPRMGEGSSIINISSVAALMGVREAAAYTAAKGGVLALSRMAAAEFAPHVRVNAICPGTVMTAMPAEMLRNRGGGDIDAGAAMTAQRYLSGRLGQPEEIAAAALFLASPESSFFTGTALVADGGVTAL